ncbi:MAG: tRNA (adenosine(37)-N6)-threonylcarbamoyltransferase complex ATPase subunit type 1 TsaE [Armatimonadota bacterium]
MTDLFVPDESAMLSLGERIGKVLKRGDIVLFEGNLGAGKTTLIRGILHGFGWKEPVRSPTYNLFSPYETDPPILHADLYRLSDAQGTGIEDYFDSHLCLIEWPLALASLVRLEHCPKVQISTEGTGRLVSLSNINL